MMPESDLLKDIQLGLSKGPVRLWRANAGKAWQGKVISARKGVLTLGAYRRVELMPAGTPDLIGWSEHVITSEDVGRTVAVFVGIEGKSEDGKYRARQASFRKIADKAGALVGIARSVEDAARILFKSEDD